MPSKQSRVSGGSCLRGKQAKARSTGNEVGTPSLLDMRRRKGKGDHGLEDTASVCGPPRENKE